MRYLALFALALAACGNDPPPAVPAPPAAGVTCNANRVQDAVGKPRSPTLAENARRRAGARTVRFLEPGRIVTMEYRGDRLNLHVGEDGKVARVNCG